MSPLQNTPGVVLQRESSRTWWIVLAAIALVGLVVRVLYASAAPHLPGIAGDDFWYHTVANLIADGHGFTVPYQAIGGRVVQTTGSGPPTAFHPPLFPLLLAGVSTLGARSYDAQQVAGCVFGALSVAGIGVVARRIDGARTGLIAAGLAAIALPLIVNDALLRSESLSGLTTVAVLLAAIAMLAAPSARTAAGLGAAIGVAALARGEGLFLLALLAVPVVWRSGRNGRHLALIVLTAAVVIAPWTIRNAVQFHELVPITSGEGTVFAGANAPTTYHGPLTGFWDIRVLFATAGQRSSNEAKADRQYRHQGLQYAADHAGRLPVVMAARVLRTWSLWAPRQERKIAIEQDGHLPSLTWPEWATHLLLLVLAALGVGLTWRRRPPLLWLLAPLVALVTLTSALGYGAERFRAPANVALVILAAVALERLLSARGARRAPPSRPAADPAG